MRIIILTIMFLSLVSVVHGQLIPVVLDVPDSQNVSGNSCQVLIEVTRNDLKEDLRNRVEGIELKMEQEREILIEELKKRTNPLILNSPSIILVIIAVCILLILKGAGKI